MFISKIIKRNTSNLSIIKYNNPLYYIEKSFDTHKQSVKDNFDTHKSLVEKMLGMAIAGLAGTCILLKNDIDKKFEGIDKKFEGIDKKFEIMEEKNNKRFDDIDKKFEIMEEKNNKRFDDIDNKIDRLEKLLINMNNKKSSWF